MTTWTLQDLSTPEEDEAWARMAQEQEQQERENKDTFWNHRVVRMPDDGFGNEWLEIQEVYYNRQGQPCGHCNSYVGGETMEELRVQIERHTKAMALPVLDSETDFNNKWEDDYGSEY